MILILASCFAAYLRRIERFNDELAAKVAWARKELMETLQQRHELEISNARLTARLDLTHDLHDGLGGTLVASIAALEHTPGSISPDEFLAILKELRDDLRIIIDTAASRGSGEHTLEDLLGPLRHRLTRLLENHDIECRWHTARAADCRVPASQGVDILRILQEALTNVLKHSAASRVDIDLSGNDRELRIVVVDDGMGFNPPAPHTGAGAGLRSMRARAERLGGTLSIQSLPGATVVSVLVPLAARR